MLFSFLPAITADASAVSKTAETVSTQSNPVSDTVDKVGYFAGLFEKYGAEFVILSLFCVCFILIFVAMIYNYKKLLDQIIKNGAAPVSSPQQNNYVTKDDLKDIVDELTKSMKQNSKDVIEEENAADRDKHKESINVYINAQLAFKDACRIAMNKLRCQRVAIYLFHNGNSTPFGFPFAKMSCVYECTMKGIETARSRDHVDVPLHAFSNIVNRLVEDNEYVVNDIYNHSVIDSDQQILDFVSGSNTKAFFALAIREMEDNSLVAFTIAEFKDIIDFANPETYKSTKEALSHVNENIYSIVVSEEFAGKYNPEES